MLDPPSIPSSGGPGMVDKNRLLPQLLSISRGLSPMNTSPVFKVEGHLNASQLFHVVLIQKNKFVPILAEKLTNIWS